MYVSGVRWLCSVTVCFYWIHSIGIDGEVAELLLEESISQLAVAKSSGFGKHAYVTSASSFNYPGQHQNRQLLPVQATAVVDAKK